MPALIFGSGSGDDGPGPSGLQPGQAAGVAVGIVVAIVAFAVLCCYLKCGICLFGAAALRRKLREDWNGGPQPHQPPPPPPSPQQQYEGKDVPEVTQDTMMTPGQRRYAPEGNPHPRPTTLADAMQQYQNSPHSPSSAQPPSRPYMDNKVELSAGDGHAINGPFESFGGGLAIRGPFELPADTPAARARAAAGPNVDTESWRTSAATASTLFQYTPNPSYALAGGGSGEEEQRRRPSSILGPETTTATTFETQTPTRPSLALLSPTTSRGSFIGGWEASADPASLALRNRQSLDGVVENAQARGARTRSGELKVAPEALRNRQSAPPALWSNRQSLVGVVEEQARGGDELKETVPSGEVEKMLRQDKWKVWRRFGGGAGTG